MFFNFWILNLIFGFNFRRNFNINLNYISHDKVRSLVTIASCDFRRLSYYDLQFVGGLRRLDNLVTIKRRKKLLLPVICITVFGVGFGIGRLTDGPIGQVIRTLQIRQAFVQIRDEVRINSILPPAPDVSINAQPIPIVLGEYEWVSASGRKFKSDAEEEIKKLVPVTATAGAKVMIDRGEINTPVFGRGIHSLRLGLDDGSDIDDSSSFITVPQTPGLYRYRIECEWMMDQGQAVFYFALEVQ